MYYMRVLSAFKAIVLTVALAAFVFNVLSPDTPTPSGVVKDQSDAPTSHLYQFSALAAASRTLTSRFSALVRIPHAESILELTCARLC